jgi:hypothetical protein
MKLLFILLLIFFSTGCLQSDKKIQPLQTAPKADLILPKSYDETREEIEVKRNELSAKCSSINTLCNEKNLSEIIDYWVSSIGNNLYNKWQNTTWDFNGTAAYPNQGPIACGYFVTVILRDMALKIDRRKLAVCTSSAMMMSLTPNQKLKNLSYLSYVDFYSALKLFGKGVYIIGLDFHTGFIVNDGKEVWFIHSNYIKRKGVTKETVLNSAALKSSKTRWLISLTNDKDFLYKWLKG